MAKRRRKKEDPIQSLMSLGILGSFFGGYYVTNSWYIASFLAFLAITIFLVGSYVIHQKREERLRRSGIHEVDKMEGNQFEHYLAQLFRSQGFKANVTKSAGDYGADLVIKKDGISIVVQAKRYKGKVGIKAVQEIVAAVDHYKANEAWVVTNAYFTGQAVNLANSNKVKLINREELIEMMLKMNPSALSKAK